MNELAVIDDRRVRAVEKLTADERIDYERYHRSGRPGLSPDFSARLYDLYLRGIPCDEIARLNKGLEIGQVLKARVDGLWDHEREVYTNKLLLESGDLLRQTAAESLNFLSLVLAVAHKEQGERLKKYLATGDPKELGNFTINNMAAYQRIIQTIAQLVGADQKKTVTHKFPGQAGQQAPNEAPAESDEDMGLLGNGVSDGQWSPERADAVREAMRKTK
jgi:hypothetical protein